MLLWLVEGFWGDQTIYTFVTYLDKRKVFFYCGPFWGKFLHIDRAKANPVLHGACLTAGVESVDFLHPNPAPNRPSKKFLGFDLWVVLKVDERSRSIHVEHGHYHEKKKKKKSDDRPERVKWEKQQRFRTIPRYVTDGIVGFWRVRGFETIYPSHAGREGVGLWPVSSYVEAGSRSW